MCATRYRAPLPDGLAVVELDALVVVFHRASGITHLVAPPVPELLELMAGRWLTLDEIEAAFETVDGDRAALEAMLGDLTVAGLMERA
jgi:PqqD family protein of HPr-rel-A system